MSNLKKLLAVIVTVCILATMTVPAFAAASEAEICAALGILKGDSSAGVTDEYLAKGTNRFQAALLYLRLIGLEDEALAFTGEDNFDDAGLIYKGGQRVLAYLKANPDLGWLGVGGNKFDPTGAASAQMIYKVLLEALGYKQGEDFEWADVISFAEGIGLSKIADVTELTNADMATAIVEALNAKVKDSDKTLADKLVEDGIISKDAAVELGLVAGEPDAAVQSVMAIDATTIKVEFDKAVAAQASDFALVDSSSKDVAINSATSADGGLVVILKVAEMTVGSKYTLTYKGVSKDVVATIKDDETKPALASAVAVTGKLVRATFDTRNINKDTLVASNFSLDNDAKVLDVELDTAKMKEDGQENNTVVLLTVEGLKSGKAYTLKSSNVASYEGAVASSSSVTFAGKDPDTKAPKLNAAASVAGYQVKVWFDEEGKIDESGLDIANYSIEGLEIKAAKWEKNNLGENIVVLTTSDQKSGTAYTLKVKNISDGTNVMTSEESVVFAGQNKATNQEVVGAVAIDATKVEVTFKYEANETALNVANYSIDNGISVTGAAFKEDVTQVDGLDQTKVILTTSAMKSGIAYKLTISTGVQDILGQGLKETATLTFAGKDPDTSFGSVSAAAEDKNTVKVTFGEEVDRATALTIANYYISDLGYPSSVSLDAAGKVATLKVATMTAGKQYTLTLNNIKDKAGNVIDANTKVTFTGKGDVVDRLKVTNVEALSKTKIKVTFNQQLAEVTNVDEGKFTLVTGSTTLSFVDNASVTAGQDYVILTTATNMSSSNVYTLTVATDANLSGRYTGHTFANTAEGDRKVTFVGSDSDIATFGVKTVTVIDKTHVEIVFDQWLDSISDASSVDAGILALYTKSDYSDTPITSAAGFIYGGDKVTFTMNSALADNTVYYGQLKRVIKSSGSKNFKAGEAVLALEKDKNYLKVTAVTGSLNSASDRKFDIVSATMLDENTLQVVFNHDTTKAAGPSDFIIAKASDATASVSGLEIGHVEWTDNKTAVLYFTGADKLDNANGIHYVKVVGTITALVGGSTQFESGKEYEAFAKNAAENAKPYIAMVEPLTANTLKITASERVYSDSARTDLTKNNIVLYNRDTETLIDPSDYDIVESDVWNEVDKVFYLTLKNGGVFLAGANYQIGFSDNVYGVDGYVKAKVYNPTSSKTDNSVNFGGIASARAPFAITDKLVSDIAQDGVTFSDKETPTEDTIAFAADSFQVGDTVTIKIGTGEAIDLTVNADGSVSATNIGDNTGVASVKAELTIIDTAGNKFTQEITLAGTGGAALQ